MTAASTGHDSRRFLLGAAGLAATPAIAGHLAESLGAEEVTFTAEELRGLNAAVAAIPIRGDRLQPAVLAQTAVEAPPV